MMRKLFILLLILNVVCAIICICIGNWDGLIYNIIAIFLWILNIYVYK